MRLVYFGKIAIRLGEKIGFDFSVFYAGLQQTAKVRGKQRFVQHPIGRVYGDTIRRNFGARGVFLRRSRKGVGVSRSIFRRRNICGADTFGNEIFVFRLDNGVFPLRCHRTAVVVTAFNHLRIFPNGKRRLCVSRLGKIKRIYVDAERDGKMFLLHSQLELSFINSRRLTARNIHGDPDALIVRAAVGVEMELSRPLCILVRNKRVGIPAGRIETVGFGRRFDILLNVNFHA